MWSPFAYVVAVRAELVMNLWPTCLRSDLPDPSRVVERLVPCTGSPSGRVPFAYKAPSGHLACLSSRVHFAVIANSTTLKLAVSRFAVGLQLPEMLAEAGSLGGAFRAAGHGLCSSTVGP